MDVDLRTSHLHYFRENAYSSSSAMPLHLQPPLSLFEFKDNLNYDNMHGKIIAFHFFSVATFLLLLSSHFNLLHLLPMLCILSMALLAFCGNRLLSVLFYLSISRALDSSYMRRFSRHHCNNNNSGFIIKVTHYYF